MVAIMNEALQLIPGLTVLEVGAGSGYHAATIAEIIGPHGRVYTVEIVEDLVRSARTNLDQKEVPERNREERIGGSRLRPLERKAWFRRLGGEEGLQGLPARL